MSIRTLRCCLGLFCIALFVGTTSIAYGQDQGGSRRGGDQRRGFGRGGQRGRGFGRPPGGGDVLGMLRQEEVRKLLKISQDEEAYVNLLVEDIRDRDEKFRESVRDVDREERFAKYREHFQKRNAEVEEQLGQIIGADKVKRLKQIQMQLGGVFGVLRDEATREKLGITEEQQEKFRANMEGMRDEMREAFRSAGDNEEARRKAFSDMRVKMEEQVLSVLTDSQKTKLKEMQGEPLAAEVLEKLREGMRPRRGPGGRPGDGRGRPGGDGGGPGRPEGPPRS